MLLPKADRAFIDLRKLADYSLLPDHPVGGHKAILFQQVLGIAAADALTLQDILLRVAHSAEKTDRGQATNRDSLSKNVA